MHGFLLLGSPLDALECPPYLKMKKEFLLKQAFNMLTKPAPQTPYQYLAPILAERHSSLKLYGEVDVEEWLKPKPVLGGQPVLSQLTMGSLRNFIDSGGCKAHAEEVKKKALDILNSKEHPFLIGVDHSATGGVLEALSEHYGPEDLAVIVLDYHCDFRPVSLMKKLIEYSLEKRGSHVELPPRPESYNVGSFLLHLLEDGVITHENLLIAGVRDYPPNSLKDSRDPRLKEYFQFFEEMTRLGVKVIKHAETPTSLKEAVRELPGSKLYISLDSDVGVLASLPATRLAYFLGSEVKAPGLSEEALHRCSSVLASLVKEKELVGMDVMELDIYLLSDPSSSAGATTVKNLMMFFNNLLTISSQGKPS